MGNAGAGQNISLLEEVLACRWNLMLGTLGWERVSEDQFVAGVRKRTSDDPATGV